MELDVGADTVRIDVGLHPAAKVCVAGAVGDEDPVPIAHGVDVSVRRKQRVGELDRHITVDDTQRFGGSAQWLERIQVKVDGWIVVADAFGACRLFDAIGVERAPARAALVVAAGAAALEEDDEVARGFGEVDEVLVLRAVGADRALGLELQPFAVGLWHEGVVRTAAQRSE